MEGMSNSRLVSTRPADAGDAAAIRDIYVPIVTDTVISFEAEPPDADEIGRRMTAAPVRLPWLVAETADGVAGYAYAGQFRGRAAYRWSVETTVYLRESARGRGIGRRLYEHLLAELRGLGYVSAYAGIALPNEASVGLHEAVGFKPIGVFPAAGYKHGGWVDVGWWVLTLRAPPGTPAPPRAWNPAVA
jgi:L-amino acid N-acyltransferase YncA